jgi:hypothetical protein
MFHGTVVGSEVTGGVFVSLNITHVRVRADVYLEKVWQDTICLVRGITKYITPIFGVNRCKNYGSY